MNKLQSLFNVDDRRQRNRPKEITIAILYSLLSPSQLKFLPRWLKSLKKTSSPLTDRVPWMAYGAIEHLNQYLNKDMRVFEYGSGGSTLFFLDRVGEVVSVEHDKAWYEKLSRIIKKEAVAGFTYILKAPKPLASRAAKHNYFRSLNSPEKSFEAYVKAINKYPDGYFDAVVVDGRARAACVREAYPKIKNKGLLVLDNSDRKEYFETFIFMKKRQQAVHNYFGLLSYGTPLVQTTIWVVKQ